MSMEQLDHHDAHSTNASAEGLGAWLKQARLQAGLSVEDVARALKLSGSTVQDMERDQTQHIGAPIYYKGFVRAYGKLLDLPTVALERRLSALVDSDPEPQIAQGTAPVRRNRWMERYTWVASYVVGTALLLPLLYWLVSNDPAAPSGQSDATMVAEQPSAGSGPASTDASVETPVAPSTIPATSAAPDEEAYGAPVTASLTPFGFGRGATAPAGAGSDRVQLTLAAPSWVSVEDARGERLIYRTLAAGSHELEGNWPLRVRIGNAARAELFIDGQALTLEPFIRGNVADLALLQGSNGIQAERPVAD